MKRWEQIFIKQWVIYLETFLITLFIYIYLTDNGNKYCERAANGNCDGNNEGAMVYVDI